MSVRIPSEIEQKIFAHVERDLDPKTWVVYVKTSLAIICGGILSLFICGQFGMGLSDFASHFNHHVHHSAGPVWCAMICGALFAIVPVTVLRFITSPLQFRLILKRYKEVPLANIAVVGALLLAHGEDGFSFLLWGIWVMAALVMFTLLALLLKKIPVRGWSRTFSA